jgi:hypothetical protein
MRRNLRMVVAGIYAVLIFSTLTFFGASGESDNSAAPAAAVERQATKPNPGTSIRSFSTVGIGVKMSLLGPGVQVATPLSEKTNPRFGFKMFNYSRTFDKDGISYRGQMDWRSTEAHLDWFPQTPSFIRSAWCTPSAVLDAGKNNEVTAFRAAAHLGSA